MVSTCANPECAAPFLYYGTGRLYVFEPDGDSQPRVESYWLCTDCAGQFTLVRDVLMDGVQLVAIDGTDAFVPRATTPTANKLRSGYA